MLSATNDPANMVDGARVPAGVDELGAERSEVLAAEGVQRTIAPGQLIAPRSGAEPPRDPAVLGSRRRAEISLALTVGDEVIERAAQRPAVVGERAGVLVEESLCSGLGLSLRHAFRRRPALLQPRLAERPPRVLAARESVAQNPDRMRSRLALVLGRETDRPVPI